MNLAFFEVTKKSQKFPKNTSIVEKRAYLLFLEGSHKFYRSMALYMCPNMLELCRDKE